MRSHRYREVPQVSEKNDEESLKWWKVMLEKLKQYTSL